MRPRRSPIDLAASIRQRLLNLSKQRGEEFQHILSDFAIERLLYRIGASPHGRSFILKGATLLRLWVPGAHRATWDLDLLGQAVRSESLPALVQEICAVPCEDGLSFDTGSLKVEELRAADEYSGVRVRLSANLAGARIPVQLDIGLGDTVVPAPERRTFPVMLDHPAPKILIYPREAVIAEKLEAMLTLGPTNSRMKDFHDIFVLASSFDFDGTNLARSIDSTLRRRQTPVPRSTPVALTPAFLEAPERQAQWRAFRSRSRLDRTPESLGVTVELLRSFLLPPLKAVGDGVPFTLHWSAGGPWRERD